MDDQFRALSWHVSAVTVCMSDSPTTAAAHAMHKYDTVAELDAAGEEAFCRLIKQRTGIVMQDHQLSNLRNTVRRGCEHFAYENPAQYLEALQQTHGLTAQLEYLIAGVTVGESYFFRDSEQIDLLRDKLLPEMIAARRASGNLSLRAWSAGCSQGQEIYTIALLLHELIPDIERWRIHLLGSDINSEAVGKAMRGHYSEWSFRATPMVLRERWFKLIGGEYEIHQQIRRMVHFAYLNLTVDIYPSILSETNAMDLILCRNVFIYLDRQAVQRSMTQFAHCLLDQGVLMLGASDPMEYKHTGLELVQTKSVGYFVKAGARDTGSTVPLQAVKTMQEGKVLPGSSMPRSTLPNGHGKYAAKNDETHHARFPHPNLPPPAGEGTNESLREFHVRAEPQAVRVAPPRATVKGGLAAKLQDKQAVEKVSIIKLLNDSNWVAVISKVDAACQQGSENSDLWQMKAKALANLGRMDEAQRACMRSLQLDPENKHAYLIQGLILAELDREHEAEDSLRRALYLDRSFLEAHYEIGMQKIRARNLPAAIKSLETALKLALSGDPERGMHNADGMNYRRFAQVLHNEIEILRSAAGDKQPRKAR